jgi:LuxR family transcriptional regulator, maltose regulon positive regulatory protein
MLLVAPAGYGKTTLAREWLRNREHVWYQATPASSDVAALALGLAKAAAEVLEGTSDHLRAHLKFVPDPATAPAAVADELAAALDGWPTGTRLVIDDYQYLADSTAAECLIELLVEQTAVPFLISGRERPSWITAKRLLYGEVRELGRTELAMTREEAAAALQNARDEMPGLVSLAEGWPAVIGLAALLPESSHLDEAEVPETLHEFFAEELYQGLESNLKSSLAQLSLAPSVDERVIRLVFGDDSSAWLSRAYRCGFLSKSSRGYEMHPLLRQFLHTKIPEFSDADVARTAMSFAHAYMTYSLWDDAISLAEERDLHEVVVEVLEEALESALSEGRVATVERWLQLARVSAPTASVVRLADIEVSFRTGEVATAREDARQLARSTRTADPLASRIYLRAGQIAHLDDRLEEAVALFAQAQDAAASPVDLRQAVWSRFVSLTDLDDRHAAEAALKTLEELPPLGVEDLLRASQARLQSALRWGGVIEALEAAARTLSLVDRAEDPFVRTGFLQTYGIALILSARYDEAANIAQREIQEAQRFNLDWVIPHALEMRGSAALGRRDFQTALKTLNRVRELAAGNVHTELNVDVLKARVHLCNGAPERSVALLERRDGTATSPGMHGDFLATLGTSLICARRIQEGLATLGQAEEITTHLEARTLSAFGRAIANHLSNQDGESHADVLSHACSVASETGNLDAFVTSYRAFPALLGTLAEIGDPAIRFVAIARELDRTLAYSFGLSTPTRQRQPGGLLTRREREVLELVSQGLSNRQIARTLWIAESTVKVHIRHVFEKLGARSRTEAAALAKDLPS